MYSISSKLNSAFSMIGKATADKITAKLVGRNSRFCFCVNNQFEHAVVQQNTSVKFCIFVLLDMVFCLILNDNLLLQNFLLCFFHLLAFISEFQVLKVNSILARWISAYLIYSDPMICLFCVFAALKYLLFEFCSASTELLRIELSRY